MIIIPILLAAAAGAILPLLKLNDISRRVYVSAATIVTCVLTVFFMLNGGEWTLLSMAEGLDVSYAVDGMAKLFASVFMMAWVLVMVYAFVYIKHEGHDDRFFAFYLISLGALISLCFSSNLVTMYLSFELITLMSMPLVLHSGTKEAVSAALKYLFYSVAGGFMGLFGIFFIHAATGGSFVPGGAVLTDSKWLPIAVFVAILGFGTKAGMYPMHGWLPTAHPVAPAPASAVLSAIIAKAGVVAVVRIVFWSVGADYIRGTWVADAWLILAMITVVMGSTMAYREKILKKRLAYSTVSNVSYIMLGLATLTADGATGAFLHVIAHAFAKNALFLAAGAIIYKTGCTTVSELDGIGRRMPITMACFTVSSLSLIGIPPLMGFASKWSLALGGAQLESPVYSVLAPLCLIISALLTAGYLLKPVISAYFPGGEAVSDESRNEAPLAMTIPMVVFTLLSLVSGIFSGEISSVITEIIAPLF